MNHFLAQFVTHQNRFQQKLGHAVAWLSLSLVLLSALVVVLRYGFNLGSIALQESVLYNHAILFMLGMAYTLQQDKHVRVDIFYEKMSRNRQAWVNLLGALLFALPSMLFIFWSSWDYVNASWRVLETSSDPNGLPFVYLLKTVILVMTTLVTAQILSLATSQYLFLFDPNDPTPDLKEEPLEVNL